jgi:hypothetical protein
MGDEGTLDHVFPPQPCLRVHLYSPVKRKVDKKKKEKEKEKEKKLLDQKRNTQNHPVHTYEVNKHEREKH